MRRASARRRWRPPRGARATCRASRRRSSIPLTGLPFPGNQIPVEPVSARRRARCSATRPTTRCRTASVPGGSPGTTSARRCCRSARTRVTRGSTGTPSAERQVLRPLLVRHLRGLARQARVPAALRRRATTSRSGTSGFNWNRILGPTHGQRAARRLQQHHGRPARRTTGPASATANAHYGIAGGQPIAGLSHIAMGQRRSRTPGLIATDSRHAGQDLPDQREAHLAKGRHTLKFGGQWLHYDQQRFYAGNNGLLGFITFNGAFTGCRVLRLPARPGRRARAAAAAIRTTRGRTCRTASALFAQDDFKLTAEPHAEPGPALGLHVAARREGQPAVELRPRDRRADLRQGRQHRGPRALQAVLQRLGAAARRGLASRADRLVVRGGYGISQFMEGTGANLRLPLNPPFFFESAVTYDRTTGAGQHGDRLRRPGAGHDALGQRPRVRPRPPARSSRSSGTRSSSTS